jgi:hypothetical protein
VVYQLLQVVAFSWSEEVDSISNDTLLIQALDIESHMGAIEILLMHSTCQLLIVLSLQPAKQAQRHHSPFESFLSP